MSFSLSLHFLPVLSLQTSVCSTLKFYPVFWSHNEYKIVFSIYILTFRYPIQSSELCVFLVFVRPFHFEYDSHSQTRAIYVSQLACEGYSLLYMDLHHDAYGGFQGHVLSYCCSRMIFKLM